MHIFMGYNLCEMNESKSDAEKSTLHDTKQNALDDNDLMVIKRGRNVWQKERRVVSILFFAKADTKLGYR